MRGQLEVGSLTGQLRENILTARYLQSSTYRDEAYERPLIK